MLITPDPVDPIIADHIFNHLSLLLNRDFLIDLFTNSEKHKAKLLKEDTALPQAECYLYTGKLLDIDNVLYTISEYEGTTLSTGKEHVKVVSLNLPANIQLSYRNSPITLLPRVLANYQEDQPLVTTMGRLYFNYGALVEPFGDLIPYVNQRWNIHKIESDYIFESIRKNLITVEQIKHYSRNITWMGHFTELSDPTFTQKTLVIDPAILKRKAELLEEHKEAIANNDEIVMSKIEQELVSMDKKSVEGDTSSLYYNYTSKKSYEIHRKAMFIMGGMRPNFGSEGYSFTTNSLEDGWNVDNIPALYNSIRSATYSRAKETAKGGEQTNFLIRIFQNTEITQQDCQTKRYLPVKLTKDIIQQYIYRNIIVNDEIVTLTEDNIDQYLDQDVYMRSPQFCQTQNGYCYTCMGEAFRTINVDLLTMACINISGVFTLSSLKKAHAIFVNRLEIKSLNQFVI